MEPLTPEQQALLSQIDNEYGNHTPPADTLAEMSEVRATIKLAACKFVHSCPPGRELNAALGKLEESLMLVVAGIARQFPAEG